MSINWKNVKSADATGRTFSTRTNGVQALQFVARQPYAWPGGYDTFAITDDGGTICADCVRKEYRQLYADTAGRFAGTGWCVAAADAACNVDGQLSCDNCGKMIVGGDE